MTLLVRRKCSLDIYPCCLSLFLAKHRVSIRRLAPHEGIMAPSCSLSEGVTFYQTTGKIQVGRLAVSSIAILSADVIYAGSESPSRTSVSSVAQSLRRFEYHRMLNILYFGLIYFPVIDNSLADGTCAPNPMKYSPNDILVLRFPAHFP